MKAESQWIWGLHSLEAALENCPELILEIQYESTLDKSLLKNLEEASKKAGLELKKASKVPKNLGDKRHQGVAALLKRFPIEEWKKNSDEFEIFAPSPYRIQMAYLDGIQDPRNYGAILRSAAAFGIQAVFVGSKNQCPLNGTVAQASAGNLFRLRNVRVQSFRDFFDWVESKNFLSCALDAGGESIEDFFKAEGQGQEKSPILWLLGSEGQGIKAGRLQKIKKVLTIPMQVGVESLNVSVAAAIAFYLGHQLKGA